MNILRLLLLTVKCLLWQLNIFNIHMCEAYWVKMKFYPAGLCINLNFYVETVSYD